MLGLGCTRSSRGRSWLSFQAVAAAQPKKPQWKRFSSRSDQGWPSSAVVPSPACTLGSETTSTPPQPGAHFTASCCWAPSQDPPHEPAACCLRCLQAQAGPIDLVASFPYPNVLICSAGVLRTQSASYGAAAPSSPDATLSLCPFLEKTESCLETSCSPVPWASAAAL